MQVTLDAVIELHDLCKVILSRWAQGHGVEQRKSIALRRAYLLSHIVKRAEQAPVSFFEPEVWDIWNNFLSSVKRLTEAIVLDTLSDFRESDSVRDSLAGVLVFSRWLISRLVTLHKRRQGDGV